MLKTIKSMFGKENEKAKVAKIAKKGLTKSSSDKKTKVKGKSSAKHSSTLKKTSEKKEARAKTEAEPKEGKGEEREWPNKIKVITIVELMGAPQEHIKNTMQLYIEKIKESKTMLIDDEFVSEIEKKDKFFLQFAELTITFKSVKHLIEFCFDYMPSSIEIIEPEHVTYNSQDLSNIVNDLQAKLHQLDMVVKNLRAENKLLNDNGNLILRNLILVAMKDKERSIDEIAKISGINKEVLENYLADYVKKGILSEKGGKYKSTKGNVVL